MADQKLRLNNWQRMAIVNPLAVMPATIYGAYVGNKILGKVMFNDQEIAEMGIASADGSISWSRDRFVDLEFDEGEVKLMVAALKAYDKFSPADWPNLAPLLEQLGVDYAG